MATIPSSSPSSPSLQLSTPFNSPPFTRKTHSPPRLYLSFAAPRATDSDTPPSETTSTTATEAEAEAEVGEDPSFEGRLSQVRLRYRSGTGKKAELRKKSKRVGGSSTSGVGGGMYLPPMPLKEPVSGGLKVEFGFSPYSERINGRIAILGLAALLLVELATGKSTINYHTPAIVLIQVYFVAAVGALFVKYEKEKVSVWPSSSDK